MSSTYVNAALGGALIGFSAVLFFLLNGRVAGISGLVAGVLQRPSERWGSNVAFGLGLLADHHTGHRVRGRPLPSACQRLPLQETR